MRLIDPREGRRDTILAAMEKRDQAVQRLAEARDVAARLSYGLTRGASTEGIAAAERAVTDALIVYRAASVELIDLLDEAPLVPPPASASSVVLPDLKIAVV
jgi:hypothetical protein